VHKDQSQGQDTTIPYEAMLTFLALNNANTTAMRCMANALRVQM
jgi:hypothetical protein